MIYRNIQVLHVELIIQIMSLLYRIRINNWSILGTVYMGGRSWHNHFVSHGAVHTNEYDFNR